jgi:hypothetical protein
VRFQFLSIRRVILGLTVLAVAAGCGGEPPVTYDNDNSGEPTAQPPVQPPAEKPVSCTDGVRNGDEPDVDCGGTSCAPCANGAGCHRGPDCTSGTCTGGVCVEPSCADGVRNGTETDTDCGGTSCGPCADGAGCHKGADCASGVCTNGTCAVPSCSDGVRNGTETDTDCGGTSCEQCAAGQGCSSQDDCATPLLCRDGICAPCSDHDQCGAGQECQQGACVPDAVPPSVTFAFMPGDRVLRVRFNEPMRQDGTDSGVLNPANYCVELTDETPQECTPSPAFQGGTLTAPSPGAVDIQLPSAPPAGFYTVLVSNTVVDRAGHTLVSPRHADFEAGGRLRVMSAASVGTHRVLVTFSKVVTPGPDLSGGAGCTSAATCALRYRLVGATGLGAILSAQVRPVPYDNEVILTHSAPQSGGNYTVIAANGVDGDGLDDSASGAITAYGSSEKLADLPLDRAIFTGLGRPVLYFGDGPIQVDPFADGSAFTYVFPYRNKVYLGPNHTGARAVRMDPDGFHPEDMGFRFRQDTVATGTRSHNSFTGTLPSIGYVGCLNNTAQCGPDNEDGRGLFTSGLIGGEEWLVIGGSQSGGGLDYVYMTRDTDTTLDMKYVDLSQTLEGTTKSLSAMGVFGERTYLAFPATSGVRKPVLVTLLRPPGNTAPGLDARGNGVNGTACDPAVHDACNLLANEMPGIGISGTPANTANVVMIDFVSEFNGKLYLGNNGGLMRATVARPLDYRSAKSHWTTSTPSAEAYRAKVSVTTQKLTDIEPADRAWSRMAVFQGHVYLGRNTTGGPQLWRCDPATVSGPAPATAEDCDPGDWVLIAGNGTGDPLLSQFNNPNNTRLTLLAASGEHLYVGYDNAVEGVVVYRSAVPVPTSRADFTGEGGCLASEASCPGLGGNGFGEPAANQKINDTVSLGVDGHSYLYVSVSGPSSPKAPARIYRNQD